jgi:two-component system NtrC family sensor kinase
MSNEEKRMRLFLVQGEPDRSGKVQPARDGEAQAVTTPASPQDVEQAIIDLERCRALLLENQKLITVGRLAATIAHEINNPLEAVTNLLYLIATEKNLTPQGRIFVATAQAEMTRVAQISKQALNFNRETPHAIRVEPRGLMDDVLALHGRRAQEKGVHIRREYRTNSTITAFPGEIRQVFSNLVSNAIEATAPGGSIRVRVSASRVWSDTGEEALRITIADTGCGIPAEVRRRVGEPFFTTKGEKGTGIGLWLAQSILQRHGGHLQLWSNTSKHRHGTVFTAFLPTKMHPVMFEPTRVVA